MIQPDDVDLFLSPLPVTRLRGVGKVTEEKLKNLEILTVTHLRKQDLAIGGGRNRSLSLTRCVP